MYKMRGLKLFPVDVKYIAIKVYPTNVVPKKPAIAINPHLNSIFSWLTSGSPS